MEKFKCSYCGKDHYSPVDRARCEIACEKAERAKKEAEKRERANKEKQACEVELMKEFNGFVKKVESYQNTYNESLYFRTRFTDGRLFSFRFV